MADEIQFRVLGVKEVAAEFERLLSDLKKKDVLSALRAAARPFVLAARANAPVLKTPNPRRVAGTLRRNIKAFASKKFRGQGGVIGVYVTVKASRKDLKNSPITGDPYYWRWVEGGHRIVPRSRRVGTRGGKAVNAATIRARRQAATAMVKPHPFLGPTFPAQADAAVRLFEDRIAERIAKANQGT